jgi:AraC-like DNA-binding protein
MQPHKPTDFASETASIPSNYARLMARALGLLVQDLPRLLANTGLSVDEFLEESTLLKPSQQIQILDNALHLSDDEAFGLTVGKMLTPATHGAMGFLVNSSPNLLTAMQAFQTFSPTRMSFVRLELIANEEWLECHYHVDLDVSDKILRCMAEASAMTFFNCAEHIIGVPLKAAITYFKHRKPDYADRYRTCLPGKIEFSHPHTVVKIPIDMCRIANISANQENYLLAFRQCEAMLNQLQNAENSFELKLKKLILSHPPGTLSEEDAAATMFISKRTLARRLKAEGTGFRQIRDGILAQQATSHMRDSSMSVEAIAALLNYHDSSNFRRAFKRWFGMTPETYRKQI